MFVDIKYLVIGSLIFLVGISYAVFNFSFSPAEEVISLENQIPIHEVEVVTSSIDQSGVETLSEEKIEGQKTTSSVISEKTNPDIIVPIKEPIIIPPPLLIPAPTTQQASQIISTSTEPIPAVEELPKPLPPIDESSILKAVVKIQCLHPNGVGKSIGSGFVLKGGIVVTAAHLLLDSGSKTCDIIFPNGHFPIHYLQGERMEEISVVKERLEKEGIDIGFFMLPDISSYPDAKKIFGSEYPAVLYPVCEESQMFGDTIYHYGYPSNFKDLNYLSRVDGELIAYADINGIVTRVSENGGGIYKAPDFSIGYDESILHPYGVTKVGIFYGDSGGLAFNRTKACVLGVNHGFGKGTDANYTIFLNLGWQRAKEIVTSNLP